MSQLDKYDEAFVSGFQYQRSSSAVVEKKQILRVFPSYSRKEYKEFWKGYKDADKGDHFRLRVLMCKPIG